MHEVLSTVADWQAAGISCATATIIRSSGSVPRPVGTVMAVARTGSVAGSISGGCIESDIVHVADSVMHTGIATVRRYSVDDDDESLALMCGGTIDVLVQRAGPDDHPGLALLPAEVAAERPVAVATVVTDGTHLGRSIVVTRTAWAGSCGNPRLDAAVVARAGEHLDSGASTTVQFGYDGDCTKDDLSVLISSIARPPHMIVVGAVDFARALVKTAKVLGYSVTLCDARPVFATTERFPEADEVIVRWPQDYLRQTTITPSTVICVLTHDPRFDVPTLDIALRSPAGYVGAMGSRRTHADRVDRLREGGLTDTHLSRLCSPIGLDLGAATPEETAVSIVAEIVALRRGGSGRRLTHVSGPIHRSSDHDSVTHPRRSGPRTAELSEVR